MILDNRCLDRYKFLLQLRILPGFFVRRSDEENKRYPASRAADCDLGLLPAKPIRLARSL